MESLKSERKINNKTKKQVASVLIALSVVLLFLTTFEFIYPVKAFLLGVFGFMLYPIFVLTILFCSAILSGREFVYSAKYILFLFLCYIFFVCILQIIFTGFSGQTFTYGSYLIACFNSVYTPGGLLIGVFTYPLISLLHSIAGIVIYSIAFIISMYFVLSYLDGIKQGKIKRPEPKHYNNFNRITTDLEEINTKISPLELEQDEQDNDDLQQNDNLLGSALKFKESEVLKKINNDDDIFIKDEETKKDDQEINLAKERLGLLKKDDSESKDKESENKDKDSKEKDSIEKFKESLYKTDEWQNRAINTKEEKPQKFVHNANASVYNNEIKRKPINEENAKYLKTLFELNLDRNNPIINAENYEDYVNRMKIYKEEHSRPYERDYNPSLNVNPNASIQNDLPNRQNNNAFNTNNANNNYANLTNNGNNYSTFNLSASNSNPNSGTFNSSNGNIYGNTNPSTANNYQSNINANNQITSNGGNNFDNFGIENNNYNKPPFNTQSTDYTFPKFDEKIKRTEPNFATSIEGLDDAFIKPISPFEHKVSPLNPVNFDLSQDKFAKPKSEEVNPKFMERQNDSDINNIASSIGTTYSLENTYNLPKSLRPNTFTQAQTSVSTDDDEGTIDKNAGPNFRYESKYVRPSINLLDTYVNEEDQTNHEKNIEVLERALDEFRIPAKVEAVRRGCAVTRYELHMPAGIPVRKIHAHASDIALALAAKGEVRIETPIKGKSAVGIEVPNAKIDKVGLKDIIASKEFSENKNPLNFALGKNVDGEVYCCNLAKMPHLLVAGSTGSGKSVCLNTLLISLIYKTSPEDLRLILVDPKLVEFAMFNNLPHLLLPKSITEPKKALNAFDWLINEMERRYLLFQDCYVKDIIEYNAQPDVVSKKWQKLPYIVLIVDELADLVMTTNKKELEEKVARLTQKARAAGIHLILATQRPSVDIITGVIKANLPARIAFAVTNYVDSKTILDQGGAEKLLGKGDMLYLPSDAAEPSRIQGAFVDTQEIKRVLDFVKENNKAVYDERIANAIYSDGGSSGGGGGANVGAVREDEFDELMPDALRMVIENGQASISMLQRRFSIGFARAARIIDQMERAKFISNSDGSKPRNVFITMDDYNQIYGK